ncbi:putative zinc-finger of transcription factor IIIC complex-domain-containing protein [Chytriomyces cf. hyalinus JEL632]|nr:putative zinc-finger of transcription factor IIIC complex-domain-containing protein [Chytriomyces cf. hyalinus JEL632]
MPYSRFATLFPQEPSLVRVAISKGSKLSVWTAPTQDLNDAAALASQSETWLSSSISLPILMPVGGITWSIQGNELRIYSVDGKALTIALIQVKSFLDALDETDIDEFEPTEKGGHAIDALAILEDVTLQLYKEILGQTALGGDGDEDNAEAGNADITDAAASSGRQLRFYGAVTSANGLADILLYTMSEYEGLEYRTEKSNRCFIIIHWKYTAKLPSHVGHLLVERFTQMANMPDLFNLYSSGYLFWDILSFRNLHRKESTLEDLINRIMETLQCSADHFQDSPPLNASTDASSSPHTILQQVPKHLFLNRGMNCLRLQNHLKLGLINTMPGAKKTETAVSLLANYKALLRDYISTLLIAVQVYLSDSRIVFSDTDTLMLTLLTDWCLCNHESVPATLKPIIQIFATLKHRCQDADIQTLCDEYILKIRKTVSSKNQSAESTELENQPHLESKEECLACRGAILFSSPWKAVCANGHAWDRCAVSLLTAATPKMRSCLGCNRKSISPLALYSEDEMEGVEVEQQQETQQSILMRGMLEYMNSCIYCANRLRS